MDVRDLGRDDEVRDLEQLVVAHVLVADYSVRTHRVVQARTGLGVAFAWARKALTTALCSRAKNRVMKTQADAPVVRESGGFLAGPLR